MFGSTRLLTLFAGSSYAGGASYLPLYALGMTLLGGVAVLTAVHQTRYRWIDLRTGGDLSRRAELCHNLPAVGYNDQLAVSDPPDVVAEAILQLAQADCLHDFM